MRNLRSIVIPICCMISLIAYAGNNQWTTGGPFGGSFRSFTFHPEDPNIVFASGDGLFRSTNSGGNWLRIELFGSSFVRIHPKQPEVIIAAGRFSSIFRSPDRGITWEELSSSPSETGLDDLEFHPKNPQILYAISTKDFVKSTDGGRNWSKKNSGLRFKPVCDTCADTPRLEISPVNPNVIYVLSVNRQVFKSTNGGESWKPTGKELRLFRAHSLALDAKNPNVLYAGSGTDGTVFKTTDGAVTWRSFPAGGAEGLAIDPKDSKHVYAVSGQVARSTDSGQTWKAFSSPLLFPGPGFSAVGIHPAKEIVLVGRHGLGILRSTNAGKIWHQTNARLTAPSLIHLRANPERTGQLYTLGGAGISFFETRNGGKKWTLQNLVPDVDNVFDVAIHPKNNNVVVAGTSNAIAVSTDSGKTWTLRSFKDDTGLAALVSLHPSDVNTVFVFVEQSGGIPIGMIKSTDQGASWKFINRGLSGIDIHPNGGLVIDPRDGSTLLVGTRSGKVFKTVNGGRSWKNSGNGLEFTEVRSLSFDPADSKVIYAAGDGGIFRTSNGARNWQLVSEGLPPNFSFVEVDPSDSKTVFAGGTSGLFISTDGAETWSAFDTNGLDALGLTDFLFSPWEPESFYAAGFSGVFSFKRTAPPNSPVIEQLVPAAAKAGEVIAIKGRNFGATQGTSSISFAGADADSTESWSDLQVEVEVPSGARSGAVTVRVAGRKSNPHELILLPDSGNIEPASGPASGGTRVAILVPPEIIGTQYNVLFGSTLARDLGFTAPNIITCTVPPGTGTVDVSVASASAAINLGTFSYQ